MDQYIEWNALAGIIFGNCRFEELDLLGKVFGSCDFKDCKFNHLSFRKCQFSNCRFQNCQIINSDLTRAKFHDCSFRNSQFLKSDLVASNFWTCEFSETIFKNSNLDLIVGRDLKFYKSNSNEGIEVKSQSNFANIWKDMDGISSDEDEMDTVRTLDTFLGEKMLIPSTFKVLIITR